jgi:hypothetical protein
MRIAPPRKRAAGTALLAAPLLASLLLAACAEDAPPPATSATAGSAAADASAYDAKPLPPVGTTPNTVAAESQQAVLPPPLPAADSAAPASGSTVDGIAYPVTAAFVVGYADILEVQIHDRQAADEVELVAPGGATIAAYQLDQTHQVLVPPRDSGINVGVAVAGGSSGDLRTGIGFGFPIFGSAAPAKPVTEVLTRARLRIADLAAYRADWQHWVVRVRFGVGGPAERKMEIAAPAPPAGS